MTPSPLVEEKSVAQIYEEVLEFFKDESRFATGYYQYDTNGNKCGWADGHCYCVLGAICFFSDGKSSKAICLLQRVSELLYGKPIQEINDGEDGYNKVIKALEFARNYWKDKIPTEEDLGKPIAIEL